MCLLPELGHQPEEEWLGAQGNLRCVFCQNWDISQKKNGWELKVNISVSDPDSLIPDQGFLLNPDPDPGCYDLT
jgi:hypothetical protein